jgi:hypothetical protein
VIAALEASIPDAAALVFACLGVALALHGRRALRARALNLASVAASVFMNAIAAAPGWRDLAIWIMPPVAYALASDTLIGVVRARAIARRHHLAAAVADDTATPLAALGGLIMWLLRLILAPVSTLTGFRAWVLAECPVAPGRHAPGTPVLPARPVPAPRQAKVPSQTKTARFPDRLIPGPSRGPEPRLRPRRPAPRRPRRTQQRQAMIIKFAVFLAIVLIITAFGIWAFLPARYLPGHRARQLR